MSAAGRIDSLVGRATRADFRVSISHKFLKKGSKIFCRHCEAPRDCSKSLHADGMVLCQTCGATFYVD